MIRFCFDWCCTDLNRPWPHVAESKVQEISRNLFFSFKRIIGGTEIQSMYYLSGARGGGTRQGEHQDSGLTGLWRRKWTPSWWRWQWQWWWQEWPMTIVACTFPCRWWPKALRVRRDPRWAGLFHLRHQCCHNSHHLKVLILPLLIESLWQMCITVHVEDDKIFNHAWIEIERYVVRS